MEPNRYVVKLCRNYFVSINSEIPKSLIKEKEDL